MLGRIGRAAMTSRLPVSRPAGRGSAPRHPECAGIGGTSRTRSHSAAVRSDAVVLAAPVLLAVTAVQSRGSADLSATPAQRAYGALLAGGGVMDGSMVDRT